jgi:hypothetical protein
MEDNFKPSKAAQNSSQAQCLCTVHLVLMVEIASWKDKRLKPKLPFARVEQSSPKQLTSTVLVHRSFGANG